MADVLRSGYKMLNLSCPICNNPIFQTDKGEMFCVICNKKVVVEKDKLTRPRGDTRVDNESKKPSELKVDIPNDINVFHYTRNIITSKIKLISELLEKESQIDQIERYIIILRDLFKLLSDIGQID